MMDHPFLELNCETLEIYQHDQALAQLYRTADGSHFLQVHMSASQPEAPVRLSLGISLELYKFTLTCNNTKWLFAVTDDQD